VLDVPVAQGESVKKGALLAELDPRDIELQVSADRSAFEEARSQMQRMQRLLEHEAVSRQEFESAQTRYAQVKSAYENSLGLLKETKLRAPFASVVERKFVDNYERVQAGQSIVRVVNPVTTKVQFTMPESGLSLLSLPSTRFEVEFDNYRGVRFPAVLKDYAKTSSDASGFPVSLRLTDVDTGRYSISPGMSCMVTMQSADPVTDAVSLPVSAVYAPAEGGTYVWVVIGGHAAIHQWTRIGDHAMIQGGALLGQDAPPFVIVRNDTMRFAGINKIGLSRRGFTPERIGEIHDACRILFQSGLNYMSGCEEVEKQVPQSKERDELVKFIRESKRGIIKPYESVSKEE
jgi:multidrug efflux system membrane fusion protein